MNSHRTQGRMNLFQLCRRIPADEAARLLNIQVTWKGARGWARCPRHGEDTPSMMFDRSGRWYCFGCGRGGDSADLWAAVRGVRTVEAARELVLIVKGVII